MPRFIFAYHGGKMPDTPEQGALLMQRWRAWMDGISESVVEPGNPVGPSKTVEHDGIADHGGPNPLAGYSIVEAPDIDAAAALTRGCPHLEHGSIEIAELMDMEM